MGSVKARTWYEEESPVVVEVEDKNGKEKRLFSVLFYKKY